MYAASRVAVLKEDQALLYSSKLIEIARLRFFGRGKRSCVLAKTSNGAVGHSKKFPLAVPQEFPGERARKGKCGMKGSDRPPVNRGSTTRRKNPVGQSPVEIEGC